jgi:hypothetical protein
MTTLNIQKSLIQPNVPRLSQQSLEKLPKFGEPIPSVEFVRVPSAEEESHSLASLA